MQQGLGREPRASLRGFGRRITVAGVRRRVIFDNHLRPRAAHGSQLTAVVSFNDISTDQQVQALT